MLRRTKAITKVQAIIVAIVVIVAASVGAYAYLSSQPTKTSILIGASLPLTGGQGTYGTEMYQAYKLAVNQVNGHGGLYIKSLGKSLPVVLKVLDDESNPSIVTTNYQQLIQVDKIDLLLGEVGSVGSLAADPIAEANHIPIIDEIQSVLPQNQANNSYIFDLWPSPAQYVGALVSLFKTLPSNEQPKTFLLWTDDTSLGQAYFKTFNSTLPGLGYTIVGSQTFTHGATDYSSLITSAEQYNPDMIILNNQYTPDTINIIKEMKLLNFSPKMGLFALQATSNQIGASLGNYSSFILGESVWSPSANWPGNQNFSETFASTYGVQGVNAGIGYAAIQILFNAIESAGTLNTVAIDNAIWKTNMTTVMGPISFTQSGPDRGRAIFNPILLQWQNSQTILVYPQSVATGTVAWPWAPWNQRSS